MNLWISWGLCKKKRQTKGKWPAACVVFTSTTPSFLRRRFPHLLGYVQVR